ncbi:MAG: hypothetical protein GY711_27250 [bacterium]|nr:hypothetical protein [bacterium]
MAKQRAETEEELGAKLPKKATRALEKLLKEKDGADVFAALVRCGEAALDLDRAKDFDRIAERLGASAEHAAELGTALSRPRFLLRGVGGLDAAYLEHFAEVLDATLVGYDELFGFAEWSKVPGKKLRVRVHLEEKITRPPHFAPQYPFHSEIDFPVIDPQRLRSPTKDGKFLFYGLCHELGHVIAMWGDRRNQADHHTWAHYTGVLLVEHLTQSLENEAVMKHLRDVRWRSLAKEREKHEDVEPGTADGEAAMALWIRLHDAVGSQAIGAAINYMDAKGIGPRVNRVRYYGYDDLAEAFAKTLEDEDRRASVAALLR